MGGLSPFNSSVHHGIGLWGAVESRETCNFQSLKWGRRELIDYISTFKNWTILKILVGLESLWATGSAGLASGFHTKSIIFKGWNESLVSQNVHCDWKMKCWKASFVAYFHMKRSVLLVAFGGSESIQFERAPRDRTLGPRVGRRRITRNMQFSKFKMRATWIDRLHFNLQNLDSS